MYSACGSYKNLDTHTHTMDYIWGDERSRALTAERHPGTSHYRKQIAAQKKKGFLIFEGEGCFFVEKGNCVLRAMRRKRVITLLEK